MALVVKPEAFVTWLDAASRSSDTSFYVTEAAAKTYVAAADQTARDGTAIGALINATKDLSLLTAVKQGVRFSIVDDAAVKPTDVDALRGNKLTVGFTGSGRGFVVNIPGRDLTGLTISNGIEVSIDSGDDMEAFVTAFNAIARDINGNPANVSYARLDD